MAEDAAHITTSTPSATPNPSPAIDQIITFLKSKDDTSKFVGLALLKPVLDNREELQSDPVIITKCWAALSPRFLDRLLRASESKRKGKDEARNMVDLAVGVIHAFTVLLPPDMKNDEKLLGRCEEMITALVRSSPETTTMILRTLLTFSSGEKGPEKLLSVEDWSPLLEIAPQQSLATSILKFVFIKGAARPDLLPQVRQRLGGTLPALILAFRDSSSSLLLELLADLFKMLPPEALPSNRAWLRLVSSHIQKTILAQPTFAARKSCTIICSALLQLYPETSPSLLFRSSSKGKEPAATTLESKPFAYLFINLILIDIRSSFPSLFEHLASHGYSSIAERLTAGFVIVAAFVGFLVKSLDEEAGEDTGGIFLQIEPDLLLKLRRDIAETMGLTIEFLRDRWDGIAAPRLDESSRTPPAGRGTPLSLTWDTREGGLAQDHFVLAAVRTLALWLREDENETLRREASGIMDVFLGLYKQSSSGSGATAPISGTGSQDMKPIDFRLAILTALEGILTTDDGIEAFQESNGWEILWEHDLSKLLTGGNTKSSEATSRGIEVIRVLLAVVEYDGEKMSSKEEWMDVVKAAAALPPPSPSESDAGSSSEEELQLSLFQFATEILSRAPVGLRRRFAGEARVIAVRARGMIGEEGLKDGAVEVLEGLEGLGIGV
ncbi:hypothetical protein FGG08_001013 [Glutinoglossum americanum]|uniref:DUF1941-domain-containing protein n=1 Tax=Glutinoglossum americanum TaxID=1670608 RepID=A0A9P8L0R0_9PEZI|nr:hypothetical protein FGG08_001013 [Glutinoglossum americanum]